MDWMEVLEQVFELIIYNVLSIAGVYLTYLISTKIKELKQKTADETAKKYLDMLDSTIQNAVLATTQTYVDTLKKQGKFDMEAQKVAFSTQGMSKIQMVKVLRDESGASLRTSHETF